MATVGSYLFVTHCRPVPGLAILVELELVGVMLYGPDAVVHARKEPGPNHADFVNEQPSPEGNPFRCGGRNGRSFFGLIFVGVEATSRVYGCATQGNGVD